MPGPQFYRDMYRILMTMIDIKRAIGKDCMVEFKYAHEEIKEIKGNSIW